MKQIYFIAEVGKASNGDLAYCQELLKECKKAGVQAVRFHHFFPEENVYPDVLQKSQERAWSFKLHLPFLSETLFSLKDYQTILRWCRELDLEFIATPWDLKSLELFKSIGVAHYKINSLNVMNIPLVQAVLKMSKKTYLSTGGMLEPEVAQLCEKLNLSQFDTVLLHAVLAYPAPSSIINIRALEIMKKYHPEVGYSSNDLTKTSILMACSLGATVIERHVHLERPSPELHKASVLVSEYAKEIEAVKEMLEITSRKIKAEARGEMINQEILAKSFALKENLPKGSVVNEQNVELLMPAKGVHAKRWFDVVGKKTLVDLEKGKYLFSTQVEGLIGKKTQTKNINRIPGKRGVVVRFKDIEELTQGHDIEYVEVHYAGGDLKVADACKEYDLDLVVHLPEYSEGKLLDLCSLDESLRLFSIKVINEVMQRARKLKPLFKRCEGALKFIVHPGATTPDPHVPIEKLHELFYDSMKQMDASGLEVLIENMTPYPWYLDKDWSPKQTMTRGFLDAQEIADFCSKHNYTMCLDVCHAQLYCNHVGKDLYSYMKIVKPYVKHLHYSDCLAIDGEGFQVGDGDINWQEICEIFEDFKYGWTPEIWNGHLDRGEKFYEAHDLLNNEFEKYFNRKQLENDTKQETTICAQLM